MAHHFLPLLFADVNPSSFPAQLEYRRRVVVITVARAAMLYSKALEAGMEGGRGDR